MKYKIIRIEKSGMMNHWDELQLPDDAIPFHTEIWKKTCFQSDMVHDLGEIFNEDGYKYDKETGEVVKGRKDGEGLEEFKIVTKIYCLTPIPDADICRHNAETASKIAKMIEDIKKRKYEQLIR